MGYALALLRDAKQDSDRTLAAAEMSKAAEAGLPLGIYLLGTMSESGIGLERDVTAASRLYERAASMGLRQGAARWGLALLEGRGVPRMR